MKINFELNEMQQKHDRFVANRKVISKDADTFSDSYSSSDSTGSEYSLKRKYTQVFHRGSSYMTMLPAQYESSTENISPPYSMQGNLHPDDEVSQIRRKRKQPVSVEYVSKASSLGSAQMSRHISSRRKPENKENEAPYELRSHSRSSDMTDIYKALKNVIETSPKSDSHSLMKTINIKELQTTISNLQTEQTKFRSIIQQQQSCIQDYHTRCVKAQHIVQTQQFEIEKLNSNNKQLETEITAGIDQLRLQIDQKLRDVSHLPQMMREEQLKYEKVAKDNSTLTERLRTLQSEATQLKLKLEELGRRKVVTINRLKAAERDLKIFKNYNTALKHEKRKLGEELQKVKDQLDNVQNNSKRTLSRQREQNEKQRRELQKRVFELELKLSRSQNSTTSLIQERDSLIAELQTQLNTLVHNFEVSQKHIRVLRRHIYSMSGGNVRNNSRILAETM